MIGIYRITNLCNGKNYVGQSIDVEKRWRQHKQKSARKENTYLQKAFAKYGIENFDFDVLQECTKEELNDLEIKYIEEFKAQGKAEYNIASGGYVNPLQYKTEEEMEIFKKKVSQANTGKKTSDETKEKMRAACAKNGNMRKIICIETGEVYESVAEIARTYRNQASAKSSIRRALRENKYSALGCHWRDFNSETGQNLPVISKEIT
jgi:hypothetical protein